jgi:predicted Zn-dependent peptidase
MFEIQPEGARLAYAISAAFEVWDRFVDTPLDEGTLDDVRGFLIGSHLIALETVRRRMSAAVGYRLQGRDVRELDTLAERVSAVPVAAVAAAPAKYGWGLVSPVVVAALDGGALDAGWTKSLASRAVTDAASLVIR